MLVMLVGWILSVLILQYATCMLYVDMFAQIHVFLGCCIFQVWVLMPSTMSRCISTFQLRIDHLIVSGRIYYVIYQFIGGY